MISSFTRVAASVCYRQSNGAPHFGELTLIVPMASQPPVDNILVEALEGAATVNCCAPGVGEIVYAAFLSAIMAQRLTVRRS